MRKFLVLGVIIVSFGLGFFFGKTQKLPVAEKLLSGENFTEVRASGYKFISPLLECENFENSASITGLNPLQIELKELVARLKSEGKITDAAIYFRDLNNGPWMGINEHTPYSPASLLKLPVFMAYLKKAESEKDLLDKKIKYEKKVEILSQVFLPKERLEVGKEYSIIDLLERMIIYSDNESLVLLQENIDQSFIDKVTVDLGVETAAEATPEDYMSVKGYAGLFRILYNASYLEKNYSEKALEILSRTDFKKGIVAGVPKSITVSHKFGERELPGNIRQFHDCGIVYHPKSPYLLCVMTRGNNFMDLEHVIAGISSKIFEAIEKKHGN